MMVKGFLHKPLIHILLITAIVFIGYSHTFSVPFHLDDKPVIVENPIIKDLRYFTEPLRAKVFKEHFGYHTFRSRYIGYLTFALNYRIHGLDPTGYHIVNILIHICTALLVYLLVHLTFQTPFLLTSKLRDYSRQIAFFAALFFACHPVQTEAVTYIWQRVASLATMFYLLSLTAYIKWRLIIHHSVKRPIHVHLKSVPFYLISLLSAVLAMKTKQIAFTLPIMVVLYEFLFFKVKTGKRVLYVLPFLLTLPIIPLTLLDLEQSLGDVIGDVGEVSRDLTQMSRLDYLFTQFRVIVTYLRLIVLPINQNLDYDYPVFNSFFITEVVLAFLLLAAIFGTGLYLLYRSRRSSPHLRIIAFGIFWFFITLSVESGFIPIKEIIFEYRVYLPSAGIFLAFSMVVFIVIKELGERSTIVMKAVVSLLVVIIVLLTGATFARNTVWKDDITVWQDVVRKSPGKARPHSNLAGAYKSRGELDTAIEQYQTALKFNPDNSKTYNNLGVIYKSQGLTEKAIAYYKTAIKLKPDHSDAYNNLGNAYLSQGFVDKAVEQYRIALQLNPYNFNAHNNLGYAFESKGLINKAIGQYQKALKFQPDLPEIHYNLGTAYKSLGFFEDATRHFIKAIKIDPSYIEANNSLGNAYQSLGSFDKAIKQYKIALKIKPDFPDANKNLGFAYFLHGDVDRAIKHLEYAVSLDPQDEKVHLNLGLAYKSKGLANKASEHLRIAQKLNADMFKGDNKHK
jgi:tetratricopeptide (TPR) repeat protein